MGECPGRTRLILDPPHPLPPSFLGFPGCRSVGVLGVPGAVTGQGEGTPLPEEEHLPLPHTHTPHPGGSRVGPYQTQRGDRFQHGSGGCCDQKMDSPGNSSASEASPYGRYEPRYSEEDDDVDLAYFLPRGQVRLVQGGGETSLQLIHTLSDSDDDNDSPWEGRLGDRYNPPVDSNPDTRELECNEIKTQVELATGQLGSNKIVQEHSFPRMLRQRERGLCHHGSFSPGERSRVVSHFLPNYLSFTDSYFHKAFCGVYSKDGQIFMSACQDQTIRLYDCRFGCFHKFKSIKARDVGWSVLDVAFTPDGNHFLYSSWSDYIHICNIYGEGDTHTALDLRPDQHSFIVFSIAVSSDGREVLGGANNGCLYIFDREQNRRVLQMESHDNDVNAVSFADTSSHILFSGGDDAICKVWDRRTMREDDPKPVGALAGHRDGITFIDSKGDARYLITNSKDQTIKLWDIRRFSGREGMEASRQAAIQEYWDYRWQQVPKKAWQKLKLPGDSSVMTYRGHGVLHTLIRCRFSPAHSTGQRYIYSGCSTGKVVIYDLLSGQIVKKLSSHKACVRDVSWHPFEQKIVSSSWDGNLRLWQYRPIEYFREDLLDSEDCPTTTPPYNSYGAYSSSQ